mmetsp:Transcript_19204/g.17051  ORF Transcript_19204/g.17051 Transcript_19204/m.17051 type:complete len:333 (-) Transcript_19204:53-1051(-)
MTSENDEILCWVSILSDVVNVLFGSIFIPLTIFKFYESHNKSVRIKKSIGYITIGFFSISTIVPLAWILFRAESCNFGPFQSLPELNKSLTATLLIAVLVTHKILFNIYMLLRLYFTFKNTVHTITIKEVSCYGLAFLIEILCQLIYDFNEVYGYHSYLEWAIYVYMLIDIILSISLISLFFNKLYNMVLRNKETGDLSATYGGAGSEWLDYGMEQNTRQVVIIRTMVRQALLCSVAILSRLLVDILILFDEVFYHPVWNINFLFIVRKVLSVGAIMLQILCIYLSYHFAESLYNSCCSCCHKKCQKNAEKCANKKYERDLNKQVSMNYFRL